MLKKGSALVCTDISDQMIEKTREKFANPENEYTAFPTNRQEIEAKELAGAFDLESHLRCVDFKENERYVMGSIANNEMLPFKDATFDCYLGNLSLMLVDNYKNMLNEALRVT